MVGLIKKSTGFMLHVDVSSKRKPRPHVWGVLSHRKGQYYVFLQRPHLA